MSVMAAPASHFLKKVVCLILPELFDPPIVCGTQVCIRSCREGCPPPYGSVLSTAFRAFQPAGCVIIGSRPGVEQFLIAGLRPCKKRDAIMGPRNDQRSVCRCQTCQDVAAQTIAEDDGVIFSCRDSIDPALDGPTPRGRNVVVALIEKLQIQKVGGFGREVADLAEGNLARYDFKEHGPARVPSFCGPPI